MRRWVNVLVVVFVLVFAGGLVIAAVPRVRHAAARTQCTNNLKQLGIALEIYHGAWQNYPPGTIPAKDPDYPAIELPPEKRLSCLVTLVPFLDQTSIVLDLTKPWDAQANLEPRFRHRMGDDPDVTEEAPVGECRLFRCPSNTATATSGFPGLTHYVGVAGVGVDAADRSTGSPGVGFFGHDRLTRQEDVKDGLAMTVAVSETTWKNGPWTAGGQPTVRGLDPSVGPYLGAGSPFGSNHRRDGLFALTPTYAANVLFADCSVRCLTDSTRPAVLEALATIAGGEDVGPALDW
jgi:hypothetical protein